MRDAQSGGSGNQGRYLTGLLPGLLAITLIAAAFWMTAARVVALEVHIRPPVWVINAIPAALSDLYFGHPRRYTTLTSVKERFEDRLSETHVSSKSINPAIRKVGEMDPRKVGDQDALLGSDDKGIVDLITLGFVVFGFRAESVTTAYFALLLVSCAVYVLAFWRSPSRLLLVAAFLAMLYLVLPMVTYNGQLRSILALRAMPVLSMVACLHCLLFLAGSLRERASARQIGLVTVQVVLIGFTIHLRSTTIWQVATIVGFGLGVLIVPALWRRATARLKRPRQRPASDALDAGRLMRGSPLLAVGSTLSLVVAAYFGVQVYHAVALPEEYQRGDEIATRVFWHNIFSGLAFHPELAERYQLRIDDSSVFAATGAYLAEIDRLDLWREMRGDVPGFGELKFATYDPVVREMFFARCSTYVRACAEAMLYYKPVALAGNLAWLYGLRPLPPNLEIVVSRNFGEAGAQVKNQYVAATQQMDEHGQRAYLWSPMVLLIILPFIVLMARESREETWVSFAAASGLTLGSTIPTVVGYPVAHTILESAIAFGMLTYLGICLVAAAWLPRLASDRWPWRRAVNALSPLSPAAR